jgi:hypothetical protein
MPCVQRFWNDACDGVHQGHGRQGLCNSVRGKGVRCALSLLCVVGDGVRPGVHLSSVPPLALTTTHHQKHHRRRRPATTNTTTTHARMLTCLHARTHATRSCLSSVGDWQQTPRFSQCRSTQHRLFSACHPTTPPFTSSSLNERAQLLSPRTAQWHRRGRRWDWACSNLQLTRLLPCSQHP